MPLSDHIKPEASRPPTWEEILRARAMYVEGFTVSRILAATNMSLGTLYYWLDGGPLEADGPRLPPIPRRRKVVGKRRRPLAADRVSLAARLWRTAERQARDIEERLARPDQPPPERERDARMLAVLVRALRDLSAFDAGQPGDPAREAVPDEHAAQDADAIRAELLRRIHNMRARAKAGGEATPDERGPQDSNDCVQS